MENKKMIIGLVAIALLALISVWGYREATHYNTIIPSDSAAQPGPSDNIKDILY